ncbi:MAG: DUF721 domain-containing protein [Desulfobacterales bacterium]
MQKKSEKEALPGMQHIGGVIPKVMATFRHPSDGALTRIWELWDGIVGEVVAQHARPDAFKGKLLLVNVSSSTWLHHLQFLKRDIIDKVNEAFGETVIQEIKFKIGSL